MQKTSPKLEVIIALGANLGNPAAMFERALAMIESRIGHLKAVSSYYCTEPLNSPESPNLEQPEYLNACAVCTSDMSITDCFDALQAIESELGRERIGQIRWAPRTIDIDLIAFGSQIYISDSLQVPHPRMHERDFVLIPLKEVAPNFIHPATSQSVSELLHSVVCKTVIKPVGQFDLNKLRT